MKGNRFILIVLILTGIAYAIGESLGYIPGAGIVDQIARLRIPAEPVTITRTL